MIRPFLFSFRSVLAVVLAVGAVQVALYWIVGMVASTDGATPIPQPDTLLYCQAARRIVEGAPFSYSAGTAVSTGTTSVLYPFLLAIPYWLGCRGNALLTAGFLLNAAFFLVFLGGWSAAFRVLVSRARVWVLACLFLALFGQTAFSACAQSDIGVWMAVSGLVAAGVVTGRFALLAFALILSPWIRPEGMVCVLAFACVLTMRMFFGWWERPSRREWLILGAALLSVLGVFVLNAVLMGSCQYSSLSGKGHFANLPFFAAVRRTVLDLLDIGRALLFGAEPSAPRVFLFLPLWGGILLGVGAVSLCLRRQVRSGAVVLLLVFCGGVLTVAQSGWQNTNLDRYLAWLMPVPIFLISEGAVAVARHLKRRSAGWVPIGGTVLFVLLGCVTYLCIYGSNCEFQEGERHFMEACERTMPAGASVGGYSGVGMAYGFSDRRFAHLTGIYSPEFTSPDEWASIEDLKRHPEKRFDYWLLDARSEFRFAVGRKPAVFGESVLEGPNGMELRKADWTLFDWSARVPAPPEGTKTLVARIDIGSPVDERLFAYRVIDRYARRPFDPFLAVDDLNGRLGVEAARLVIGGDEMNVPVVPGHDLGVVLRTLPKAAVSRSDGVFGDFARGEFGPKLLLNIQVDGRDAGTVHLTCATNGFSDMNFKIPGPMLTRANPRIAFLGDHVACAYWFYQ